MRTVSSSPGDALITVFICLVSLYSMKAFITPSKSRKAAETDVPIILPILLKESNLLLIAEAVAATMTDVTMTILTMFQLC